MIDREKALELWRAHNDDDYLYRHALSVEAAMRWWARKYGENEDYWGCVGLLHDVDYQEHPDEHLQHSGGILSGAGYGEEFIHAVNSHGFGICAEVEPALPMEKILFATDKLTGFLYACALVRPSKSLDDLETKSVLKRMKDSAFAAKIDRAVIRRGAEMIGMPLEELIAGTIEALRPVGEAIGLRTVSPGRD